MTSYRNFATLALRGLRNLGRVCDIGLNVLYNYMCFLLFLVTLMATVTSININGLKE